MIEKYIDRYGVYREGDRDERQGGVLRINCIDCLDRTNVVQGWLARKQLDKLLTSLGLLTSGSSIKDAFPEVFHIELVWLDPAAKYVCAQMPELGTRLPSQLLPAYLLCQCALLLPLTAEYCLL